MQPRFTLNEVSILFEYAVQQRRIDAAGLALKAAQVTNADSCALLAKALEKSDLHQMALASGLTQFARHDQLALILELLRSNSEKLKLAAILTLQLLKDPVALEHLKIQINESDSETVIERATVACRIIAREPVALLNNTFYTCIPLTPFEEEDEVLADFILNRDLSNKDVPYLVKLLYHPLDEMRTRAMNVVLRRGRSITDLVFEAVAVIDLPVTRELMNVFVSYKDPRGAQVIIKWVKVINSYLSYAYIEALKQIGGEESAHYLAEVIVNGKYYDGAIEALKKSDKIPVSYLLAEYKNNDHFRRTGAESLAEILGKVSLPALLEGIQDRYREVRKSAELGLSLLGKPAIESLITLLNSSNDEAVRLQVCSVLGSIGDKRALIPLVELTTSKNKYLHWGAISAIGQIPDPSSVRVLSQWIESPERYTRLLAAKGLGLQNSMGAVEQLLKRVDVIDDDVRLAVITALYKLARQLKNAQSIITAAFLQLLSDENNTVAAFVENSLIDLGYKYKNIEEEIKRAGRKGNNQLGIEKLNKEIQKAIFERESNHDEFLACCAESQYSISTDIPCPITDSIQLSVSAPLVVCSGRSFILDVWAYVSSYNTEIYKLARAAQRDEAIMLRSKNAVQVQRDTILSVRLNIPDFNVKEKDIIYWGGTTGNCTFPVKVPDQFDFGFYLGTATFHVGPLQIAKLDFEIEVGQQEKKEADITSREHRIKTAFASYASDDRDKVLGRIQGMLKLLPELDIFLDVASLRSGEDWASRLEKEIEIRDIFYLFWSSAASKSPWVEKEWRIALLTKGISCIDPIPLEPPAKVPPPPELSSLHFNDWTLAFEK